MGIKLTKKDKEFILDVYMEIESTQHECVMRGNSDEKALRLFPNYTRRANSSVFMHYGKVTGLEYVDLYIQVLKEDLDYYREKYFKTIGFLSDIVDDA